MSQLLARKVAVLADKLTASERSATMSRVRNTNTKPEMQVRKLLHGMGYRFRLHRNDLPGTPDIVLPRHRKVIFVHGCFWHGHKDCKRGARPVTNIEFWNAKLDRNEDRDRIAVLALSAAGWKSLILWQCQINKADDLRTRLRAFLIEEDSETELRTVVEYNPTGSS